MNVPKGFKQTEVGVIPEDWKVQTIGNSMRLINGCAFKPDDWKTHGTPIIRIQNLNDPASEFNYFSGIIDEKNRVKAGTLLFAWSGTKGTSFGARIWNGPTGVLNQHIYKVVPYNEIISNDYAFLSLRLAQQSIEKQAHGFKESFVHVKKSDLIRINFPLPPSKAEQLAIATALFDMDALIEGVEKLLEKKRWIKQGAMQELLRPKEGWVCRTIKSFTDATAGGTPNTEVNKYWNGDIRWMNSGELHLKRIYEVEGRITESGLKNSSTRLLPKYCVLIGLAGQGKTRGTVAINQIELCTNQSIAAIFPNDSFVPDYLYYNLDLRYIELRKLSTGDGGRGGLNLTLIRAIEIPFPSTIDEQKQIVQILNDMDAEIYQLETQLTKYQQLKTGMMQELLTGKKRLV